MSPARTPLKHFIGHHEARTTDDALELALGTPLELWLGVDGESDQERAAREDAARDIIADDPELFDRVTRLAAGLLADSGVPQLAPPERRSRRRTLRTEVAA